MACAPSADSDQTGRTPGHPPSLIRVFAVRMKKPWVLSYALSAHRRLWSDWTDAQADLSLRWALCHFLGFVMRRLEWYVESYVATGMLIAAYSVKTRGVWIVMTTANLFIFATFARKEYSGKYISAKHRYYHMSRSTIKPTTWPVRSAKTPISLNIRPVWSLPCEHIAKTDHWLDAYLDLIVSGRTCYFVGLVVLPINY